MMNLTTSNHHISKVVCDFNLLTTLICYVLALPELLPVMLLLGSTDYDFSHAWTSHAHAIIILSNQGDMNAADLMGTGTQEEIR